MKMSDYAGSPLEVQPSKPTVGGWLRYICLGLAVLGPIRMISAMQAASGTLLTVIYSTLIVTSVVAGITTWGIARSAFLWLRIHFAVRLLYGLFQVYVAFALAQTKGLANSDVQQEFIAGGLNLLLVLLLFLYFRLSSRVHETFGRNI